MAKKSLAFLLTVSLVTFLFIFQTTMSNMLYLYQMGMPVDLAMVLFAASSDLIGMNFHGALPPIILVVSLVFFVAFLVAKLLLNWITIEKKYFYAFAGASGIMALVTLFPPLVWDMEMYRGAQSVFGKIYLTATGALGGYMFGINLKG